MVLRTLSSESSWIHWWYSIFLAWHHGDNNSWKPKTGYSRSSWNGLGKASMSWIQLAELTYTTKSHISKIENGIITPSVGAFYRIVIALGMRIEVVKPVYWTHFSYIIHQPCFRRPRSSSPYPSEWLSSPARQTDRPEGVSRVKDWAWRTDNAWGGIFHSWQDGVGIAD